MMTARIFFATALLLSFSAKADHIKVFLLGGQSNMVGTGADTSGLSATLQSPQADVLFYYSSSLTTLRPGSGQNFGPEVTFGRTIADAFSSDNFGLIKYASSGSDLTSAWDPATGTVYSNFRTKVTDGLAALTTAGHTYEIVGMLWTQGERDARIGRNTAQYEFDLNEFIADIRTRYGADLPFFLNRLSTGQTDIPNITLVRAAQENVAASDPFTYLIDADGMSFHDELHFDAAGQIALGEAFGQTYINSRVPDTTDPLVDTLSPTNGSTDVPVSSDLVISFDEAVAFDTGFITIRESVGDAVVESYDVGTPPVNLSLGGSSITINPTADLANSTGYYVEIDANAIDDLAGNSFAGFSGTGTWGFTTEAPDLTDPTTSTLNPSNEATNVAIASNLEITFSESVAFGTGSITLKNAGGAVVESFDVSSPPANLSLNGATLTIDPTAALAYITGYYVEIDATAIDDLAGNSFAGFTGSGTWAFTTTEDPTAGLIGGGTGSGITVTASEFNTGGAGFPASQTIDGSGLSGGVHANTVGTSWLTPNNSPAEDWIEWDLGASYTLDLIQVWNVNNNGNNTFSTKSVDIYYSNVASPGDPEGAGAANWTKLGGASLTLPQAPASNNAGFDLATATSTTLPTTPVRFVRFELNTNWAEANTYTGIAEIQFFSGTVGGPDTTPPAISTLVPVNTATGIDPAADLSVVFDEDVAFGSGFITIRETIGDGIVESYNVSTPPANLSLSGGTINIDPTSDLAISSGYYVEIDTTAIDDLAGNSFAGISGNSTWSFTTGAPDTTAPTIDNLNPTNGAVDVSSNADLEITFTENVTFGTGSITLKDAGGTVIESFDVGSPPVGLSLAGSTVTINPTSDLSPSTGYYVEIDANAIDDLAGNSFAGFSGNGTWSFTTVAGSTSGAVTFGSGVTGTSTEVNSTALEAYSGDVSSIDQLNGLTPTADGNWFTSSGRTPANLVDGLHGTGGDVGSLAQPESPPAVVVFDLGTGDNGLGYDLTSLVSIASWNGVGFGNQVWTLEVAGVGEDGSLTSTDFSTLLSADYRPLGSDAGSTKITVTGLSGTLTSGVQYVRITGEVNPDGNSGRFTWREFDIFGSSTVGADDYAAWIDGFGLDPADQDLGDDPDGDGNKNGIENYFGTHPGEFSQGLVSGTVTGNTMTFTHPLNDSPASDLTATYRWSKDLSSFHGDGDEFESTTVSFSQGTPAGGMVTVTATITGTALDKLFVDIAVTED